jgi:hypothetical protein
LVALSNTQVVQAAGDYHRQIRETVFGITQHIFDDPCAFHTSEGMFHPHADMRDAVILFFLGVG